MKSLFVFFASAIAVFAQYAPDSVANKIVSVNVATGTAPFATSGTASQVFTAAGTWYLLSATGDVAPGQNGTYVYTKTGPNTATVRNSQARFGETIDTITFTSPLGGTFTSGFVGQPAQQTGTFTIAPFSTAAPLLNISTRTVLASGQILNPGFVVGGAIPRQVLIRAVGPGLGQFGVSGTMPNPVLTVYNGQTVIASNAGWGGAKALSDAFAATGAFGLPSSSKDAAVLLTLDPGSYTATVSGSTGGDVLMEIYFVN